MIKEHLDLIKQDFAGITSAKDRLEVVLDYGDRLPQGKREEFSDEDKVPGCASDVYLQVRKEDGRVRFRTFTASLVLKGYVAILVEALTDATSDEVHRAEGDIEDFINATGLDVSLIPSRTNSFSRLYAFIQEKA